MDKKEYAKQRLKERTTSKRFKLSEGETTFRLLPNARGLDKPEFVEYAMHSNVGARKAYLRCGDKKSGEGNCWLCRKVEELSASKKSATREVASAMKRKDSFAVQITYQSDGKWLGPVLWEMPMSVANKLLGLMGRRDIANPEKGYNLTISRVGTGLTDTKYGDIDRDDEPSKAPEKVMAVLKPFGELVRKYDEALQKKEFFGHDQTEDEEEEPESVAEDEQEEEVASKGKKTAKGHQAQEPEEETEEDESAEEDLFGDDIPNLDDEGEGENDGEEEKQQKSKVGKSKVVEADSEEEEEEPKKSALGKKASLGKSGGKSGKGRQEPEEDTEDDF
jgi:hypothetical protein